MRTFFSWFADKYFGERLDFRAKLFYGMMPIGFAAYLIGGAIAMYAARGESLAGIPALICAALVAWLTRYASKSGNYQRCYLIITILIFIGQTPLAFFLNGGYKNGGILTIFMINAACAAFWFEGIKALIIPPVLIALYAALCFYAYNNPDSVRYFGEYEQFLMTMVVFVALSVAICAIIVLHQRLHDKQKRELDEARQKAVEYEKMKSEFFADMSHELRHNLTIISTSAQLAMMQIESKTDAPEQTYSDLESINQEAMRLAGMTDSALKILRNAQSGAQNADMISKDNLLFELIHIGDLMRVVSQTINPVVKQNGMQLSTNIEKDLPPINGNRETLIALSQNLLRNAISHSNAKTITISTYKKDKNIIITIEDDGQGIPPDLLPKVFDRGVSGKGSTGLGLYVCKKITQAHKGDINIENRDNGGTRVMVTLPTINV